MLIFSVCMDVSKLSRPQENNNDKKIINPVSNAQNAGRKVLHRFSNLFIKNGTARMNFSHPAGINCTKVGYKCCLGPKHKSLPSRTAYTSLLEKCLYSTTNLNSC